MASSLRFCQKRPDCPTVRSCGRWFTRDRETTASTVAARYRPILLAAVPINRASASGWWGGNFQSAARL